MDLEQKLITLTNSVQSLAEMQAKNEEMQAKNEEMQTKNEARFEQIAEMLESLAEGTARLLNTAVAHDGRLDDHEHRIQSLEG